MNPRSDHLICWALGPDMFDCAPEVPMLRTRYVLCAKPGPGRLRCDRPADHTGRCYESIQDCDCSGDEVRFVIGCWWAE